MPYFLYFVDRIHSRLQEINTRWAQSWHRVFQGAGGTILNNNSGKGASRIFCSRSHLPVAFSKHALCSWYFVFLVKEEEKQEKGQMVQRGRNWHWKMWAGPVQTILPLHVGEGNSCV